MRGMIDDRDARILRIKRKQEELLIKEERLKDELSQAAEENSNQIIAQQTEKTAMFHEEQGVLHQLDNLHTHLQRQGDSLNEYSMYIQQNGDINAADRQNVMRLQAQLCKAMHSMSIINRQVELRKEQHDKLLKQLKEALAKQSEEKAHLERSILNDLMGRDTEVRTVENKFKGELDVIIREMSALREQMDDDESDAETKDTDDLDLDDKGEEEEDEGEEEEQDEEERAAKEELMKIIQKHREEIERLEKEIEEREELIEELKYRVGEEPPPEDSPEVSNKTKKQVKEEPPKEEQPPPKKDEPVDEMAARLQQVMASAETSDAKVDDVDEVDLLKLAQSRLTGGGDAGGDDDDDDDDEEEESEEEETETDFDEDDSGRVDESETPPDANKGEEEEYDPTEKKEDPTP